MKKQNLKKVIAIALVAVSMLAVMPKGVSAAWRKDNTGWWYAEGNSYSRGWRNIGGSWYYFDNNGYMKTGWVNNGDWYYFSPSGAMQTGWIQDGGYWYYLKSNGTMVTGNVATDGKISSFDRAGKWLGYINSNQHTNNTQITNVPNSNITQANNNSNSVSSSTKNNTPKFNNTNNSNIKRNNNSNAVSNTTQTNANNTQQASASNISNNQGNTNSNNNSANMTTSQASNSQTSIVNQTNEFSIDDALAMITEYKGVTVTLTQPGPTSSINDAYKKIHKDGKVGYYIFSYLFNGRRVDNSNGILIFEDGSYKQYKQGHHPSELDADEWIKHKKQDDAALKDFLSHGQPQHDGNYNYYYNGVKYSFTFTEGMEQGTLYKTFHGEEFDRDGYYIETADDYLETANIRNS